MPWKSITKTSHLNEYLIRPGLDWWEVWVRPVGSDTLCFVREYEGTLDVALRYVDDGLYADEQNPISGEENIAQALAAEARGLELQAEWREALSHAP